MINVTEPAVQAVSAYFESMDVKPIRIFLTQGCGGQQLAMALDTIGDKDAVHEAGGFQFIMDRALLEQAQPVEIDYADKSFRISSKLELSGGCQSCGTAGSCCSS
ncbi:HesB-like domain protein [Desulfosarcina cetonica]|uniref:IscA/HesB family protein n=1 Tax=Desulfosarcina cetonica TaxID=90730 RepID=UPI0006D1F25E|nr:IscA/HesB family protein [Desulfosarcina cetonica]VTR67112.1 HesB-like domain protein [Desulfosarcina cetonica]